jgi:hypothetical protein
LGQTGTVKRLRGALPVSLVLALLFQPASASAQSWFSEMPSEREVVAKVKGADRGDTLARQNAAFDQLASVLRTMQSRRQFSNPAHRRLLTTYGTGASGAREQALASIGSAEDRTAWNQLAFGYSADDAFRDEIMQTFFSQRFQTRYASRPDPEGPPEPTPLDTADDDDAGFPKPLLYGGILLVICAGALASRRRRYWDEW